MDLKVSVIMAVYNAEKYLRQSVDSLLAQTLKEIEVILVDDGSADCSLDILHSYEKADSRVRVLENLDESDGAASARNLGVSHAKGSYLSIVDADDFFEPDMLEKAYEKARTEKADVVIFDGYRFDDTNQIDLCRNTILVRDLVPKGKLGGAFSPDENRDDLFRMTLGAAWNCLFSAEMIRMHDLKFASFHHADDMEFVYMAFALAKRIAILPERLVHYRVNHADTQASMVSLWPDTAWQAMCSLKEQLTRAGVYEKYRVAFIRVAMKYQLFYLSAMKNSDSFRRLYEQLREVRLKEMGIANATIDELGDEAFVKQRDIILREDADGYLFAKANALPPFDAATAWKADIPKGSRVIVFGADRLGVDVVHSILWYQDYKLVSWVDEQSASLGYPVRSLADLSEAEYDFILIVSRSKGVYEDRKVVLLKSGIDENRIRWQAK